MPEEKDNTSPPELGTIVRLLTEVKEAITKGNSTGRGLTIGLGIAGIVVTIVMGGLIKRDTGDFGSAARSLDTASRSLDSAAVALTQAVKNNNTEVVATKLDTTNAMMGKMIAVTINGFKETLQAARKPAIPPLMEKEEAPLAKMGFLAGLTATPKGEQTLGDMIPTIKSILKEYPYTSSTREGELMTSVADRVVASVGGPQAFCDRGKAAGLSTDQLKALVGFYAVSKYYDTALLPPSP